MKNRKKDKNKQRVIAGKDLLPIISIVLVTVICLLPVLQNGLLQWDDRVHLTENRQVKSLSLENIGNIFTSTVSDTYIPLTILSFAIEHHFAGWNPFVYHLDNLILHLLVVVCVYIFILQLGFSKLTAFLATMVFAIHPTRVESVAWVTERKDVLYGMFYMLALNSYLKYVKSRKMRFYVISIFMGIFSILAKPMALSLPLILFAL